MSSIENKVAIVTGSTSGIDEGIAKLLAERGEKVVINSVYSVEKEKSLAGSLSNSIYIQGNIGLEADCKNLINKTMAHYGRLDILINNAGQSYRSNSDDNCAIGNDDFKKLLDANVVGTWCIIREALPYLKKSGDGNIVNITSCAGIDPASASSGIAYTFAKAAINHLTKFLAKECGPEIRVNGIAPC